MEIFAAIDKIQKGVDNLRLEELIEVFEQCKNSQ